jgi:hypothetical protein
VKAAVVDPWRFNVVSEKFQKLVAGQRRSGLLSEVLPKRSAPVSFGCLDGVALFGNKEALRVNDCSAQKCGSYSKVVGSDPQINRALPSDACKGCACQIRCRECIALLRIETAIKG